MWASTRSEVPQKTFLCDHLQVQGNGDLEAYLLGRRLCTHGMLVLEERLHALYKTSAIMPLSYWTYHKELSSREKQQKEFLNADPASSKRITGALFQLVSLKGSHWHPERKENSCKHCTASCCTQGSTCRPTADYNFTKLTLKSDGLRPTHYI